MKLWDKKILLSLYDQSCTVPISAGYIPFRDFLKAAENS